MIDRFRALVDYYASLQGRLNLFAYAFIALKWSVFGPDTAAWQLARFAQMCGIVMGVFILLRRLDTSRAAAVAGASLFISASGAAHGWYRLTMGEPLGFMLMLGAALVATAYHEASRWRPMAAAIALLLVGSLLAKEMLVGGVPFVLFIACCWRPKHAVAPLRCTPRNVWLIASTLLATAAVLLPVGVIALSARPDSFSSAYGTAAISAGRFVDILQAMLLPVYPVFQFPANLLYLVTAVTGWWLVFKHSPTRRHPLTLLAVALSLPVMGAVLYLPWPKFEQFYRLPFLLGPALLLAWAVTWIQHYAARAVWIAYIGCAGIVAYSSINAQRLARTAGARQEVNAAVAGSLVAHASRDSVMVATPALLPVPQRWWGPGPSLRRYAGVMARAATLPPVRDADCLSAAALLRAGVGRAALISYSTWCGVLPHPTQTVRRQYSYIDWLTLTPRTDSLRADIFAPETGSTR